MENSTVSHTQQHTSIVHLSHFALTTDDVSELLAEAAQITAQTLKVEFSGIWQLVTDNDTLLLKAGTGWLEEKVGDVSINVNDYRFLWNNPFVIINDTTQSDHTKWPLLQQHHIKNGINVGIKGKERPFGVLGVYTLQHRIFTHPEIYFLQSIANILAMALELKESKREISQLNSELLAFQSASSAVTSSLNLEDVLYTVAQAVTRLLNVPGCAISTWNQNDDTLVLLIDYGPESWTDKHPPNTITHLKNYPLTKRVLVSRTPQQITTNQPNLDAKELSDMYQFDIEALLMLPMIFQDRVIGMVEIYDDWRQRTFTDQEIMLAQLQANQAAGAIDNARLYSEAQQRLVVQSTLQDVITAISSTLDLDIVLANIAEKMAQAIDATSVYICNFELDTLNTTVVAHYISPQANPQEQISDLGTTYNLPKDFPGTLEFLEVGLPEAFHVDSPTLSEGERSHFQQFGVRSVMSIPIKLGEKILGFTDLWESRYRREFTQAEIDLCQEIVRHAAITIENAQLYAKVKQQALVLEQRVSERTIELTNANKELRAEIARRECIEKDLVKVRDQALEASRLKTELLAKVSHELRTPLGSILGYTELLEFGTYGPISNKQREILANMMESTQYQINLINELLDQAQIEAGTLKLNIQAFSPTDIIKAVYSKMKLIAQEKELNFRTEISSDLPSILLGDPKRIQQILLNLVGNALKFTEHGTVQMNLYPFDKEYWAVQVSDTGPGIPLESQAHIFEPFGQVDGSITRKHRGTGLGLSIVKQLVSSMGGHITLKSTVGQGSIFTVQIPFQPTQSQ